MLKLKFSKKITEMQIEEIPRNSKPSPAKTLLQDVKYLNKLYERFQAEYGFKLFQSRRGSFESNRSAEAKKVEFKDDSDHGTPDDEEEYLAIKRRKLKSKLLRKGSQSPKQGNTNKGASRTGPAASKETGEKIYVSPYSIAKTKPTGQVPGSLRSSKNSSTSTNNLATLSSEKKKISKRLKGMSLLRIRDQFKPAEEGDESENDDFDEEPVPEISEFRDNSHAKTPQRKQGHIGTLNQINTLNNINVPSSKHLSDKKAPEKRGSDKKR